MNVTLNLSESPNPIRPDNFNCRFRNITVDEVFTSQITLFVFKLGWIQHFKSSHRVQLKKFISWHIGSRNLND